MTPSELTLYYQNLLIMQYITLPKAYATIGVFASEVVSNLVVLQVENAFAIESAVGVQLDTLGSYVGARRIIPGFVPSTDIFFALSPYDDPLAPTRGGFALYADSSVSDFWALYTDQDTAYVQSDGELRNLILYLADLNALDNTIKGIDDLLFKFFGTYATLTDNQDMTITYTHNPSDPSTLFGIVNFLGLLPHPCGVEVIVV